MSRKLIAVLGMAMIAGVATASLHGAEWKPAKGPLMTRWAKDVSPQHALPDYPRPQLVRDEWQNLNGIWELAFAKEGEAPPVGQKLAEQILVPFPVESALSGVMRQAERLWYRKTFTIPRDWAGKRVLLHFGAVDWETTVWVNGKKLGVHRGGFDPFSFDVTDVLKADAAEQEVLVGVWDPTDAGPQPRGKQVRRPEGIFYMPTTGIWQTVWLEPVPYDRVGSLKIVPDVDAGKVRVTVHAPGAGHGVEAEVTALDGESNVATTTGPVDEPLELAIPHARLWSPDTPFLYSLKVTLQHRRKPIETVRSYFGMRKIAVGPDEKGVTRLLLNGKPIFQVGPLDQGFWPDGIFTAPTDEALRYDIEITKKLGFNTTRKHVKVEPERWYYWCDRLGLLVWQDMPAGDRGIGGNDPDLNRSPESAKSYHDELKAMIHTLRNHPSIIMWVVFNEGWGQFDTAGVTSWTKAYDPSRLVDSASGWTDRGVGDVHDMHNYPGPGTYAPEPHRAAVLGEFGGLGLGVDGHTWSSRTWGYRGTASKDDLTRKYEQLLLRAWRLKDEKGLSAVIYTQLTDVETEANGLLTYDRAVIKVDPDRVSAVNRGDLSRVPEPPIVEEVVPTARAKAVAWRYTEEAPGADWFKPGFDDSAWTEAPGGFGTEGTPGTVVRTRWASRDIWLRREFTLPQVDTAKLFLSAHHDEDAEIYLNGVLAARVDGYTTEYEELPISAEARQALKPGKNVLAIHCRQTGGGQYIDAGISQLKSRAK